MSKNFKKYTLNNVHTDKLTLTALELDEYIDFEVKRIYFLSRVVQNSGAHCHYKEKELFVMIQGQCTATIDYGFGIEKISMEGGKTALFVPNYVWHGFLDFTQDGMLLAVSSTNYDPKRSDYLEDYTQYLKIRNDKLHN